MDRGVTGGVVIFILLVRSSQKPKRVEVSEQPRAVRVIPAPLVSVVPRAIGYGKVQPGQVWEAVAEVGGTIVEIHPDLKRGSLLAKGAILLRIDPSSYDLAQSRGEAGVKELQAQFRELEQKEKNISRSLKVEKSSLELSRKELDRRRNLAKTKIISRSEVDQEEKRFRAVLLTSLTTIMGLLPLLAERSLQAQILIPMATSLVFGLLASTVLILVVIPALYTILGDFGLTSVTTK